MRRYDESFQKAKEVITSGKIGEVTMIKSLTHGPSEPKEWMYAIAKSSGPVSYTHLVFYIICYEMSFQ